jgi:CheY-like chemotaxis protein/anti-sigma regulatory factor (Ser/Thr protein kinase)
MGADVPELLVGDIKRVRQVLTNLISNAIKFSQGGEVAIRSRYSEAEGLCIEIEDDGIGMTKEQQERVFGYFEQGDALVYQRYGGSGLGLAICKQLVNLMQGEITVDSVKNEFTRFAIQLPLPVGAQAVKSSAVAEPGDGQVTSDFSKSLYVLAVDDNEVNRKVVSAMLNKLGYQVDIACSGHEALALIEDGRAYDLILMDCEMPGMDGYETSRRIRQWQYAQSGANFTIIALTAHAMDEYKEASLEAGMDGHLSKPIRLQELKELTDQLGSIKTPS